MNMCKLAALIPDAGTDEIYIDVQHTTLGKGRLYLSPFECPDDLDDGPEGVVQFEPTAGGPELLMGFIVPCSCGRCDHFTVYHPDQEPEQLCEAFGQILFGDARKWAHC